MDKDKHKAAMDALADLIRSQLEGEDRARFASVKRLAVLGQKLMLEGGVRAADADLNANFENGDEMMDIVGVYPAAGRQQIIGAGNDQQQMVREMVAMLGPAMGGLQGQNDAKRRESVARELNELLSAKDQLEQSDPPQPLAVEQVTKRINAILGAMAEDSEPKGDENGLPVVPPVDVRGHQARQGFGQLNAPLADGALPDGEGRGEAAARPVGEAGDAPDGLGLR